MKKIFKNICLIFVCIFALLINVQVNAEGFSDSTGGLKPTNLGGPCPQCAWVYNSSVNVGIRLGLYKYKNGQKTYYGSIDLYNNASDATYWTLTPAGQKSRLEYSSPSQVYIDKYNVRKVPLHSITRYNGGKCKFNYDGFCYYLDDSSSSYSWANEFVRDMSSWFGSDKTEIQTKVNEMFGHVMNLDETASYYIVVEPTFRAYNKVRSNITAYGTGFELVAARSTLNDPYFTKTYTEAGEPFTYPWDFWDALGNFVRENVFNSLFY